jgi:hypothetical protein
VVGLGFVYCRHYSLRLLRHPEHRLSKVRVVPRRSRLASALPGQKIVMALLAVWSSLYPQAQPQQRFGSEPGPKKFRS